jgi:predicted Zn-dependent protease
MRRRCTTLIMAAAVCVLPACQQVNTTEGGAVGVHRKQAMFVLLSPEQVNQMAAQSYAAALQQAARTGRLNTDRAQTERVRRIARRLIPQVAVFRADALKWQWEINVEENDQINAYCAPGGKIMVYSGIIERLKLNDDEIAAILGHEMAHALREHGRERMSKAYSQQLLARGISILTEGKYDQHIGLAMNVTEVAYNLPNSRDHETEADQMGLELAARAGFDPRAAISLWRKMNEAARGALPQFLSTHPSNENRIRELEAKMPVVMPLFEAARQRGR